MLGAWRAGGRDEAGAEQRVDEDLHTWRGEKHKHEMEK